MADGSFHAVGAIPVRAKETIPLTLEIRHGNGATEEPFARIPVTPADFAVERLQVAPRYTAAPDSALRVRIAAERERSRAVTRRTHGTPRLWSGAWVTPVAGRVTSPYGKQREFNGEVQSRHYGVDLDGDTGTPVYAPNRAVVALTDDTYYGGNLVYLDHGRGLVTAYLHLSEILVSQGDTVTQGQIIGKVGATGRVTGPHLHWLARYGPISVDALSLFALELDVFGLPPIRSSGPR
ncbi:MAG: M23 family metallopeptidase, partial [Gemmatimonadota bacterium]|nr:M23 family metallopeptidase [Gemmatimonadota bacterium]